MSSRSTRSTRTPAAKQASSTATPQPEAPATPEQAAPEVKPEVTSHVKDTAFWQAHVDEGYELTSWLRAHYALVKKSKGSTVEGPAWYTVTDFGTRKSADKGSVAEQNGRERDKWCEQSAALMAQQAAAAEAKKQAADKRAADKKAAAAA